MLDLRCSAAGEGTMRQVSAESPSTNTKPSMVSETLRELVHRFTAVSVDRGCDGVADHFRALRQAHRRCIRDGGGDVAHGGRHGHPRTASTSVARRPRRCCSTSGHGSRRHRRPLGARPLPRVSIR